MKNAIAATAATLALTLAAGAAQGAELITNGDFETGDLTGWLITGTMGVGTGALYGPCCGTSGDAPEYSNNHFAAFGWDNQSGFHSISQLLGTVSGATYNVSFLAGALGGGQQVLITSAGGVTQNYTVTADNNLNSTFATYSFQFTGSGSDTITFGVQTNADNIDAVVDNVSVQSAAPEPAAWALMIFGFGGVGAAMRARRRVLAAA